MHEIDLGGLFFPPLLLCGALAVPLTLLCTRLLGVIGAYRWLWHAHLFNTALFVVLTALLSQFLPVL
jgi:protein AaeX